MKVKGISRTGFCRALFAVIGMAILSGPALSQESASPASAAERGLAIAREADRRDSGFGDTTVDLAMLLNLSGNEQVRREMRQLTLEVEGDGDKSIMVFDRPRDLNGTAILTFTHKAGSDDQWLYLPALKRVKRISAADKSGPFMGSEFAYEDLSSQEVEKYTYTYLRDESLDGEPCFVVERVPVDPKSGYTRQVTWLDKSEYRLRRVDYYDRKGELLKTMTLSGYTQYLDQYWRPGKMIMDNHQNGKSTTLIFEDYRFRTGLTDSDFDRSALSRIR
ncbi:outer membrane lipoprotein-sorting protein [Marinobacterium aestuariivivens]|uniref:Outer membrane lipoprotein-sorting protein n=1 Tax=Marinobacterium aestuariivivens TaxID=1698799 RepID=A0ABW1ZUD8_9GAMM